MLKLSSALFFYIQMLLFLISVLALSHHVMVPYLYIELAGSLIICTLVILTSSKEIIELSLASIIIIGLFFRNIHIFAFTPEVIPLYDSYNDYGYTRIIFSTGKAPIILGLPRIEAVSQWPFLHILASVITHACGFKLIWVASLIVPMVIETISIVLVYLISKNLLDYLIPDNSFTPKYLYVLSIVLLYAILPHAIYETIQFIRGSLGLVFIYFLLYIIIQSYSEKSQKVITSPYAVMSIIYLMGLVFSHHFSAGIFSIFLIVALVTTSFLHKILKINRLEKHSWYLLMQIYVLALLSYWIFYAVKSFTYAYSRLEFYPITYQYTRQLRRSMPLSELRPIPLVQIVLMRDLIVYGLIAIGIFYFLYTFAKKIIRRENISNSQVFIISVLVAILLTYLLGSIFTGGADKCIAFFAPILIAFSGLALRRLIKKYFLRIVLLILILIAGIGTALAPYSHNYLPIYIYDNSMRPEEANAHNPNYWRAKQFLNCYTTLTRSYKLVSDDYRLLYVLFPVRDFEKITFLRTEWNYYESLKYNMLIIRFGNYPSYHRFWPLVSLHANRIYDADLPIIYNKQ